MKTVGIVGCQPRIGTTTQALQLTLCLMHMGYNRRICGNGRKRLQLKNWMTLYQGITIDKNDIIYCQSIPLYTGNSVTIVVNIHINNKLRYGCRNLHGYTFIAMMKCRNRFC